MNFAIIMAREGSKRIPKKHKNFAENPLLSSRSCKKSKIFDEIIVSTDSKLIADLSKKMGASTLIFKTKKIIR